MLYRTITVPDWLGDGLRPASRHAAARKVIYGGDTETHDGEPITFQFYTPGREHILWIDDASRASETFIDWCASLATKMVHVIYVHNLEFDMVSFFWDRRGELVDQSSGEFSFACKTFRVEGVYGKPTYCKIVDEHRTRTIYMVDSFSYYRGSLAEASKVFCPHLPKLERPDGLGERRFFPGDAEFEEYAMRDSVVAYHIGVALEKLHQEFDVAQTVSVAHMASHVFKRKFLAAPIPLPERPLLEAALLAYHGGKNNITTAPGWYPDVSSLDISSAYPDAMASFPSFYYPKLYRGYNASKPKAVPDLGVYSVTGQAAPCRWPILFSHDFKALSGRVSGVYVTGFELNEALRSGEFSPTKVVGWFYNAEHDTATPPLRDYVNDFYARKQAEEDPARRAMYKFLLNALSGKFVQTRQRTATNEFDVDDWEMTNSGDLIGGGLFHPFIAAMITGHTRARMHKLEHEYEALHTATDGVFTQVSHAKLPNGSGLGAIVTEATGDLMLLRNKLYILYSKTPPKKRPLESETRPGMYIIKAALHGFAGSVHTLEQLVETNKRDYRAVKRNSLRDAINRGLKPNRFAARDFELKIPLLPRGEK